MSRFKEILHKAANSVSITTPIDNARNAFREVDERVKNKITPWKTGRTRPQRKQATNYTDLGQRPKTVGEAFSSGIGKMLSSGELDIAPQLQAGQIAKSTVGGIAPGARLKSYETEAGQPSFWGRIWRGDFRDAADLTANKLGRQKWWEKPINAALTGVEAATFGLGGGAGNVAKGIGMGAGAQTGRWGILDSSRNPDIFEQAAAVAIETNPVSMFNTARKLIGDNWRAATDPRANQKLTGEQLRRHSFKDYVTSNPEIAKLHYPQLWQEWQAGNRW